MSKTVELDIPLTAAERAERAERLAHQVAVDSIVTTALTRLIKQIVETLAEQQSANIEAMRGKCETIARKRADNHFRAESPIDDEESFLHREIGNALTDVVDAIAALKRAP